ncbi:MAG TPA: GtrA family protein [Planctomycetota bacterium]|jgi:putative flippase GtrA|nr:GtrA family protein [Planctomycetota bacterium]
MSKDTVTPGAHVSAVEAPLRRKTWFGTREEIVRFMVSGGLGSSIFYLIYLLVYQRRIVNGHNSAFSWAVAYAIAAWFTHQFHRRLTFHWRTNYWESLRRTYAVYGVALVISTLIQDGLTYRLQWNHNLAFFMTLTATGCFNYLALRHWGFRTT